MLCVRCKESFWGLFPLFTSSLTSSCVWDEDASSAPLPFWCPVHLAHFSLACHLLVWLRHAFGHLCPLCHTLSLPLFPIPPLSPSLRADSTTGYRAGTSPAVGWEQVAPRDADWPHCVTLALTHVKFVFRRFIFEPPFELAWETCRKSKLRSATWQRGCPTPVTFPSQGGFCEIEMLTNLLHLISPDVQTSVMTHNPHAYLHIKYTPETLTMNTVSISADTFTDFHWGSGTDIQEIDYTTNAAFDFGPSWNRTAKGCTCCMLSGNF